MLSRAVLLAVLSTGGAVRAEGGSAVERDAADYCRFQQGVASAQSLLLVAPSLYASGGYVTGADASTGASALPPTARLTAGASYSFGALHQGLAIQEQAHAECARYATESALRAFIERNRDGSSVRALRARARVLDEALPQAAEILQRQRTMLAAARLTVDELGSTELRADSLRQLAAEAHRDVEALSALPSAKNQPVDTALAARDEAEETAERAEASVRSSHGWDLSVRGGYDRVYGVRDYVPLFAMATVTVDTGWFFQGAANSDAREARREWVRHEVEGVDDRVEQVLQRLRALRRAESSREHETATLAGELETRFRSVSAISGDRARSYADAVWFELVRVRADHAYFTVHAQELDELLGSRGKGS